MMRAVGSDLADRLGIIASTVCALHCAAGAIVVGAAGLGGLLFDERTEAVLVALAVAVATFALTSGFRRHRRLHAALVGVAGVAAVAAARVLEVDVEQAEAALSVSGAGLLVGAHVLNLRALRDAASPGAR
jgi:hypothetical protein